MALPDRPANPVFNSAAPYAANVATLLDFRNGAGRVITAIKGAQGQTAVIGTEGTAWTWLTGVLGGNAVRRLQGGPSLEMTFQSETIGIRPAGTVLMVLRKHAAGNGVFYHTGERLNHWSDPNRDGHLLARVTDSEVEFLHRGDGGTVVSSLADVIPLNEWVPYILTWQITPVPRMQLFYLHPSAGKRTITRGNPSVVNHVRVASPEYFASGKSFNGASPIEVDLACWDIAYYLRLSVALAPADEDVFLANPFVHLLAGAVVGAVGPETLVPRLTGQHLGDIQAWNSIGGIVVPARAHALRPLVDAGLAGVAVTDVSGACGEGEATLQAVSADLVQLVTPDGNAGTAVELLDGETALVAGVDPAAYVRAARRTAAGMSGALSISLRWMLNNVIGGANVTGAQATAGRVTYRAIILQAPTGANVSAISAWIEARGALATAANALASSGLGTLTFGDISSWPVDVRCVRIQTASGALREIVGGRRVGNAFVVTHRGRLGTSATAGAVGDTCTPVPPVRLASEGTVSDAVQRLASETAVPSGRTWGTGVGAGNGVSLGNLLVGGTVGLWIERSTFSGQLCDPLMVTIIGLRYTVAGVTYTQRLGGTYRVANDLAATRFRAFRSLGAGVSIDLTGVPVASAATRPFNVPLVANQINNLAAVMVNDHGLQTEFARQSIRTDAAGAVLLLPPSPAVDLRLVVYGVDPPVVNNATVRVFAMYPAGIDGDARATHWVVHATNGTFAETKVVEMGASDVEWLDTTVIAGGEWTHGDVVTVTVRTSRSDNPADTSVQSTPISDQATINSTYPEESLAGDGFVGGRAQVD